MDKNPNKKRKGLNVKTDNWLKICVNDLCVICKAIKVILVNYCCV